MTASDANAGSFGPRAVPSGPTKPSSIPAASSAPATTDAGSPDRVSETALVIAALIPSLPEGSVADLGRLIQRRLTMFDSRRVRFARLGLLVELVCDGTGEIPSVALYESVRDERRALGEVWQAHSTLSVAYGGWIKAVRAAMLACRDGSSSRVAASNRHRQLRPSYRHDEAILAFVECQSKLGCWPSEYEFDDWRRLSRELARLAGKPEPRIPSRPAWLKLYGSWPAFDAAARTYLIDGTFPSDDPEPAQDSDGSRRRPGTNQRPGLNSATYNSAEDGGR